MGDPSYTRHRQQRNRSIQTVLTADPGDVNIHTKK